MAFYFQTIIDENFHVGKKGNVANVLGQSSQMKMGMKKKWYTAC